MSDDRDRANPYVRVHESKTKTTARSQKLLRDADA